MELCKGCPVRSVDVEGELVTPTGAALATTLAAEFGGMPQMTVRETGYGAGKKRFGDRPNLLRVVVGEVETCASSGLSEVVAIETNLDDFLPQLVAPLSDRLFAAGALDVFTAPIQMKKGRPALLLTVLCAPGDVEKLSGVLFRETTTLGVRLSTHRRLCLERSWRAVRTDYGTIRVKTGVWKGEVVTASPEFEDVRAAAEQAGTPMKEVRLAAERAFAEGAFADEPGN
jgi:uncharacterized protein (DUF111 family)